MPQKRRRLPKSRVGYVWPQHFAHPSLFMVDYKRLGREMLKVRVTVISGPKRARS